MPEFKSDIRARLAQVSLEAPSELVAVGERRPFTGPFALTLQPGDDPQALRAVQPQNYIDWAGQQQVFSAIAAISSNEATFVPERGEPESLFVQRVTGGFF